MQPANSSSQVSLIIQNILNAQSESTISTPIWSVMWFELSCVTRCDPLIYTSWHFGATCLYSNICTGCKFTTVAVISVNKKKKKKITLEPKLTKITDFHVAVACVNRWNHPPLTFSRSSNIQKRGVMAPISKACVVMPMMWFRIRVISPYSTVGKDKMNSCFGVVV